MVALSLSILALAAGVYLLIKVKREFMSTIFSVLAWLVIGLSLANIGVIGVKACKYYCHNHCEEKGECRMEKQIIIKDDGMGHCTKDSSSTCSMSGCKMEGDSVVMEKEMCSKMMGKDACEAMCKERGRCILSKDECMKMCHASGKPCSAEKAETQCTKKCEGEKKECCKHKM
jgi:hypothetical protein